MSEKLKQQIREARPSLRVVSPMSFWFIALMGMFNLVLGASLFTATDEGNLSASLLIVNTLFNYKFWGVVFIALGIAKLMSLKLNSWKWARRTLLAGVSIKAAWMSALLIRILEGGSVFLALCWVTIALTQMICYIYFLPPQEMRLFNGKKMKEQ